MHCMVLYGIVQEHGGVIEVERPVKTEDGELRGTAFHVKLPVFLEESASISGNERW